MNTIDRRKRTLPKMLRNLPLHVMLIPAVVLTVIYKYVPMGGAVIAFQDFNLGTGISGSEWIGLDNFRYLLNQPNFWNVIYNTIFMAFFKMVGGIVVPVVFALLLNEIRHQGFKRGFQTLIYLPNFLSWVILGGLFIDILSPSSGIVNDLIKALGAEPIFFLGDETWFPITMIITDIWKGFGYGTIVYLAALTSIDPALYESAVMDGAGRWKQTWHITLPGMKSIVVLMAVLSLGNILNAGFEQIYIMLKPQVYATGDIIDTFVYRLSMRSNLYGPATAMGLMKSAVSLAFVSIGYKLADKFADYRVF